jgi:hypothetical protein
MRLRGDRESWLEHFAEAVDRSATSALHTSRALRTLVRADCDRIAGLTTSSVSTCLGRDTVRAGRTRGAANGIASL